MEGHENRTSIIEETILTNLGTLNEPREFKIGKSLTREEQENFVALLKELINVFAWSYKDIPSIDRDIAEHKIPLCPYAKLIK